MNQPTQAGATAPRLYTLTDLWGLEAARFVCPPAELPAQLDTVPVFGLTDDHRQQLTKFLCEMGGTGTFTARTHSWLMTSEPTPPQGVPGVLAVARESMENNHGIR